MIPVSEARRIVTSRAMPLPSEIVPLSLALDRILAADVIASISRPSTAVSAMDGYAVRAADLVRVPVSLRLAGVSTAGAGFGGVMGPGEAIRILTGAQIPDGADTIVIQEHVRAEGDLIVVLETSLPSRWIRPEAMDFPAGTLLLPAGRRLTSRDLALAAASNVTSVAVHQRPSIAFVATGTELVMPGEWRSRTQIVNCTSTYLSAELTRCGAIAVDLGIVPDEGDAIRRSLEAAVKADMVMTIGGASVGDRDLVLPALRSLGFSPGFERVAMRPGKPTTFGWLRDTPVLTLPGNPVSAVVTMLRIARPLIDRLLGVKGSDPNEAEALLGSPLPANDEREDHLRAKLEPLRGGAMKAIPFAAQDSAQTALLAASHCLVIRPSHAPPAKEGDAVPIIRLQ